jgi:Zn-dependent M28 family amino/carboxypeptidase
LGDYIEKATQYVYEFMQNKGLSVSYHDWTTNDRYGSTFSGRNVIGELAGSVSPEEIVLVTAHLDCEPFSIEAPGADDNGSGSTAVMIMAELFATRTFEKTIRFIFFTGEEQGLLGSKEYADDIINEENIVAVYNMDMIAWDDIGEPVLRIHTRTTSNPGYSGDLEIANTFVDVITTYDLSSALTPIIDSDGLIFSDHSSFWNKGIPAVLAIEDDVNDFNDNYHTSNDRLSTLNLDYFSNYIKASLGVAAHLAKIVDKANVDITPILQLLLDE